MLVGDRGEAQNAVSEVGLRVGWLCLEMRVRVERGLVGGALRERWEQVLGIAHTGSPLSFLVPVVTVVFYHFPNIWGKGNLEILNSRNRVALVGDARSRVIRARTNADIMEAVGRIEVSVVLPRRLYQHL